MKSTRYAVVALLGAGLLSGCASDMVKMGAGGKKPIWVVEGDGAYSGQSSTVLYGVGVANPMPNVALQRKMSDERAREEIAATMKSSIASMVKDYMDHHVDYFNPSDTAGSDEFSSYVSKDVVEAELIDSRIINHWEDPDTGVLYALARMDTSSQLYDQYKESMRSALSEAHGSVLRERTDEALKNLDKEIDEQRSREKEILGVTQPAPTDATPAPADPAAQ